jgi:hypothetical protein
MKFKVKNYNVIRIRNPLEFGKVMTFARTLWSLNVFFSCKIFSSDNY